MKFIYHPKNEADANAFKSFIQRFKFRATTHDGSIQISIEDSLSAYKGFINKFLREKQPLSLSNLTTEEGSGDLYRRFIRLKEDNDDYGESESLETKEESYGNFSATGAQFTRVRPPAARRGPSIQRFDSTETQKATAPKENTEQLPKKVSGIAKSSLPGLGQGMGTAKFSKASLQTGPKVSRKWETVDTKPKGTTLANSSPVTTAHEDLSSEPEIEETPKERLAKARALAQQMGPPKVSGKKSDPGFQISSSLMKKSEPEITRKIETFSSVHPGVVKTWNKETREVTFDDDKIKLAFMKEFLSILDIDFTDVSCVNASKNFTRNFDTAKLALNEEKAPTHASSASAGASAGAPSTRPFNPALLGGIKLGLKAIKKQEDITPEDNKKPKA